MPFLLCPCFANSPENKRIHLFTGHLHSHSPLLHVPVEKKQVLLLVSKWRDALHQRISFPRIWKITLTIQRQKLPFWTAFMLILISEAIFYRSLCCSTTFDGLIGSTK